MDPILDKVRTRINNKPVKPAYFMFIPYDEWQQFAPALKAALNGPALYDERLAEYGIENLLFCGVAICPDVAHRVRT